MAKCIVCGQETGSEKNCQVCGTVVEPPFFLNLGEYERWAIEVLLPAHETWKQKKTEQDAALKRNTPGTLDKTRFLSLTNPPKESVREIRILNQLDDAPSYSTDISEERNRGVLAWSNYRDVVFLAGEGGIRLPTNCRELFKGFSALEQIVGAEFLDTSRVTSMDSMFWGCTKLRTLNASGWNTRSVKKHEKMFDGVNLRQKPGIQPPRFEEKQAEREAAEQVRREAEERTRRKALEEKLQQSRERARREAEERAHRRAQEEKAQQERERARREAEERARREAAERARREAARTKGTLSKERFRSLVNQATKESLTEIRVLNQLNRAPARSTDLSEEQNRSVLGWIDGQVVYFAGEGSIRLPADCRELFRGFSALERIVGAEFLDTSRVTDMSWMFWACSSLKSLDVSRWDTSRVTDMNYMFWYCSALKSLDVSRWNMSAVSNVYGMFVGCKALTTLDVSRWDTSRVTAICYMFHECSSLTTLDVSRWDTSCVTDMHEMFYWCSSLKMLDVRRWDTSNVTDMRWMFNGCTSLKVLNASGWNTRSVKKHEKMFEGVNLHQKPGIRPPRF